MTAGAGDVGLDGFLDGAVGVMEHQNGVAGAELAAGEAPGDLLEDDGGGGCGVVDDGDLVDVVGVNQVLDDRSRMENPLLQLVEVEGVGLGEEPRLPLPLRRRDGARAAAEAAVVDPSDARVVVREFGSDFRFGDGGGGGARNPRLLRRVGFGGVAVELVTVVVMVVVFHVVAVAVVGENIYIYLLFIIYIYILYFVRILGFQMDGEDRDGDDEEEEVRERKRGERERVCVCLICVCV